MARAPFFASLSAVLVVLAASLFAARLAAANDIDLINAPIWSDPYTGIAISGVDPLSYFVHGEPREGSAKYETVWGGVAWWFSNEGNMAAFTGAPEVYSPRFGGYATLALARNSFVPGRTDIFDIWEGQLYFFLSPVNREIWRRDRKIVTRKAVKIWKTRLDSLRPQLEIEDKS